MPRHPHDNDDNESVSPRRQWVCAVLYSIYLPFANVLSFGDPAVIYPKKICKRFSIWAPLVVCVCECEWVCECACMCFFFVFFLGVYLAVWMCGCWLCVCVFAGVLVGGCVYVWLKEWYVCLCVCVCVCDTEKESVCLCFCTCLSCVCVCILINT